MPVGMFGLAVFVLSWLSVFGVLAGVPCLLSARRCLRGTRRPAGLVWLALGLVCLVPPVLLAAVTALWYGWFSW